ncbi:MAG: site-2 protease family protein, partial [Patescibacteria group bacterium]
AGQGPIFGWAKPVPINPYNFKDQKWGTLKVAISGPATNFAIAIIFGLIIRFVNLPQTLPFVELLGIITIYNFLWGLFNLVPIPPLDGSWILFKFLPQKWIKARVFLHQYGLFVLIFFIFFGGLAGLNVLAQWMYSLVTGAPFWLMQ